MTTAMKPKPDRGVRVQRLVRPRLKSGDRVKMTRNALVQKLDGPKHIVSGTVETVKGDTLMVIRYGETQPRPWHKSYWKKASPISTCTECGQEIKLVGRFWEHKEAQRHIARPQDA